MKYLVPNKIDDDLTTMAIPAGLYDLVDTDVPDLIVLQNAGNRVRLTKDEWFTLLATKLVLLSELTEKDLVSTNVDNQSEEADSYFKNLFEDYINQESMNETLITLFYYDYTKGEFSNTYCFAESKFMDRYPLAVTQAYWPNQTVRVYSQIKKLAWQGGKHNEKSN